MLHFSEKNKKNAFKTPENYFEKFQDDIQIKICEEKISEYFGKSNPFTVPEDYFEKLNEEITQRIKREPGQSRNLYQILKPYIAIAASILIIFGLWRGFLNLSDTVVNDTPINIKEAVLIKDDGNNIEIVISDSLAVKEHIDEYISDESEEVLAELIDADTDTDTVDVEFAFTDEDSELIAEYIADNLDYNDIIEQNE